MCWPRTLTLRFRLRVSRRQQFALLKFEKVVAKSSSQHSTAQHLSTLTCHQLARESAPKLDNNECHYTVVARHSTVPWLELCSSQRIGLTQQLTSKAKIALIQDGHSPESKSRCLPGPFLTRAFHSNCARCSQPHVLFVLRYPNLLHPCPPARTHHSCRVAVTRVD